MKSIILAALFCLFSGSTVDQDAIVYISIGNYAKAYHIRKSCHTIKRCFSEGHVREVTLKAAIEMGRHPCKVCCK